MSKFTAMPGVEVAAGFVRHQGRPCADHGETCRPICVDPNTIDLDELLQWPDEHLAAVTTFIVDQVHEAFEWIKLDGKRIANPHPRDEEAAWDLLIKRTSEMVREYREMWPA